MMRTILIDPGHGGHDAGAVGHGIMEKDVVLVMAKKLGEKLEKDFRVVFTRKTDIYPALQERTKLANASGADIFVSLHVNAAENVNASGYETLTYSMIGKGYDLAKMIHNRVIARMAFKNRGIKERSDLHVLKATKMPAVLLECGFISNEDDAALLQKNGFIEEYCEAVTHGIYAYFGMARQEKELTVAQLIGKMEQKVSFDKVYWEKVLNGELSASTAYLRKLLERLV